MSKALKAHHLSERPATRTLLAISLCATMAAFGCTTDRNLGNGDPVVTPGVRTSPTGNTSSGSETESIPPPMMSSYSGEALPVVRPRIARVSAAEVAAILAEHQPRVRYLGPGAPGAPNRPYVSDGQTNLFTYPALQDNSRSTVNSSLTSGPTAVVTSGAGEAIGGADVVTGTPIGTTATVTPSTATVSPTAAAVVVPSGLAATRSLSPTAAAVVNPPASVSGSQSATTLSPTATSVANPPASVSGLPAAVTRTATTSQRTTAAATSTTTSNAATASTTVGVSSPVRVVTDANGRVTVTNRRQ